MPGDRNVLVFGLDGVTFDLIDDWMQGGELPYFEKLNQEGVRGELRSTLPPITGPAWSSFQTGLGPGKHGVFDWDSTRNGVPGKAIVNSTHIQAATLWELLSQGEKRVGVIGLPVTYPPREVNGFILTGLLTPDGAENYVYPQHLKDEINEVVDNYITAPPHAEMAVTKRAWVQELVRSIGNREKVSTHLLSHESWDVAMVYFMEPDTVMHHLYHTITKDGHPSPLSNFDQNPILRIHKRVERAVSRIVDAVAEPSTDVILVSDHGFGPLDWTFNVNSWLLAKGYLNLKDDLATKLRRTALNLGLNQKNLYHLGNLLGPLGKSKKWDMEAFDDILGRIFLSMDDVDWENTRVFARGGMIGEIGLNVKGKGPPGGIRPKEIEPLKKELTADLKELRSPFTDEPVVDKVINGEEAYEGPQAEFGPDILFTTKEMRTDTGGLTVFKSAKPLIKSFATTGTHRMDGIFMAAGPDFHQNREVDGVHITDMAPTILHLANLPIPTYMDGAVATESLAASFRQSNPIRYRNLSLSEQTRENSGSDAESEAKDEEIKEQLKGLGYLD